MDPEPFSFLPDFDSTLLTGSIALAILLLASALISGAEVALFSLTQKDLDDAKETKSKSFEIIIELLKRPKKLLASILVANNFINIAIVILFTQIGNVIFKSITSPFWQFTIEVVVATFLILLFGEILPKIYASRNDLLFSRFVIYPLLLLDFLLTPISLPMQKLSNFIKNTLLAEGMIDAEDLDIITLTDDLDHIAGQIKASLGVQIKALKEVGMENTQYYQSLKEFFDNRNIIKGRDSYDR